MRVFSSNNPDVIGEALRNLIWPPIRKGDLGCYNNFVYSDKVYNQYEVTHADGISHKFGMIKVDTVEVKFEWYWDGDGYIQFRWTPDEVEYVLENEDCKKTDIWELF